MIVSKKYQTGHWLAAAVIPGLLLFGTLSGAAPAAADSACGPGGMQQNHVNARNGAANGTAQPMSRQAGNQPTSGPCHASSGMGNPSNTGVDTSHAKAAARVNQQTGAQEGPAVPLSTQKGNQPTSPTVH